MEKQPLLPSSRKEALEKSIKRYFTGKPCKYGHVDDRKTSNGRCVECDRLDALKKSRDGNHYYWRNRDKILSQRKESGLSASHNQNRKEALALNPLMAEKRYSQTAGWKKRNRSRVTHQEVVRQRGLKDDFDKLSSGEKAKIDEIYQERDHLNNEAGFKAFHVDHIVPVSKGGKHHPDNLQILTARENLQKKDRLE